MIILQNHSFGSLNKIPPAPEKIYACYGMPGKRPFFHGLCHPPLPDTRVAPAGMYAVKCDDSRVISFLLKLFNHLLIVHIYHLIAVCHNKRIVIIYKIDCHQACAQSPCRLIFQHQRIGVRPDQNLRSFILPSTKIRIGSRMILQTAPTTVVAMLILANPCVVIKGFSPITIITKTVPRM